MENRVERRKHKRMKLVCDAVAFIRASDPDLIMVARIVDISHHGLTVSHFGDHVPPHTSLELDIVLPGGEALLAELAGISVWEVEVESNAGKLFPERHCGIEFRNHTRTQISHVEALISHYTEKKEKIRSL